MKVLIVDDEPPARRRLSALVEELGAGQVVGEASNGTEALRAADRDGADVVLLDIRMPGMDGLEVARHLAELEEPPAVIFTTAYDEHALAAFEANAVDYLLKPIRKQRLAAALERCRRLTRAQLGELNASPGVTESARTHISATLNGNLELVLVAGIRFFRAEHKYVSAYYPEGSLLIDDSLNSLEYEFGDGFLRVHRNALVAPAYITGLVKHRDGGHALRLAGVDDVVEVSRRTVATVRKVLKAKLHGS